TAVHPDYLAPRYLATAARLQLQSNPAVGRHLHGSTHRRFLLLGTTLGPISRPTRPSPLRHHRTHPDRTQPHRTSHAPDELLLSTLCLPDPVGGILDGHVRGPEHQRRHEQSAGASTRRRQWDAQHLPELGRRAVNGLLLYRDHRWSCVT